MEAFLNWSHALWRLFDFIHFCVQKLFSCLIDKSSAILISIMFFVATWEERIMLKVRGAVFKVHALHDYDRGV